MSMKTRDLLVEIGTEELPPKVLATLAEEFFSRLTSLLLDVYDLKDLKGSPHHYFYSPRRLAIVIENMRMKQQDRQIERFGPAVSVAFDEDSKPTKAAEGFARSSGTTVDQLEQKDGKLFFSSLQPGAAASDLIPTAINEALAKLPIPKRMHWGSGTAEFVRPVHWAVVLFGNEVIDCEILGVQSGRNTYGHRYHHPEPIKLKSPSDYVQTLRDAKVWLNDASHELQGEISLQAHKLADEVGGNPLNNETESALVAEIAALVEWPVGIRGTFDPKFLTLPEEILIATLEDQQRYFPVRDKKTGKLLPHFITVANIESKDIDQVRHGNERVIVPRLTDAMFFWNMDQAATLESRIPALDEIVFQNKLGSIGDKMRRVSQLAVIIAKNTGSDLAMTKRAVELAKCDLVTNLVDEFPELQGTIGRYLAQHDDEHEEVATAIEEQYLPRFAGDKLPATMIGQALSIADKIDTLVGVFSIGQIPTGEKDPFGLRRAALGIIRMLIEMSLPLNIVELLELSISGFTDKPPADTKMNLYSFFTDRLNPYLRDRGYAPDEIDAVLSLNPVRLDDILPRLDALKPFRSTPEGMALAAANKRIHNILRQAGNGDADAITPAIDGPYLEEVEEQALVKQLADVAMKVSPLTAAGNYTAALRELSGLRNTVDAFFDKTMVMVDDEKVRLARLQLLAQIRHEFQKIADISRLQG